MCAYIVGSNSMCAYIMESNSMCAYTVGPHNALTH